MRPFGLVTATGAAAELANETPVTINGAATAAARNSRREHDDSATLCFIILLFCFLCDLGLTSVRLFFTQSRKGRKEKPKVYFAVQSISGALPPLFVRNCSFMIKNAPMP